MATVADISLEQRNLILALPEGHFHDLKSKDIAPGKLTKTISGFANAAGGELYIGVDERLGPGGAKIRSWRGFADPEEANGHLQAFEQVSPLGTYVRATFLHTGADAGLVLQLEILKTREIVKASDGVAYVRRGAQNLPQATEEQIARLRLDKGIASFETETVRADSAAVTNSTVVLEFGSRVPDDCRVMSRRRTY